MNMKSNYGVDVALRRADDLDKLMLDWVMGNLPAKVLDLGCGAGGQSLRLASLGAKITAVDILDYSEEFKEIRQQNSLSKESLRFFNADIKFLETVVKDEEFDICSLQRVIHYLNYQDALKLLAYLRNKVGKKLYISVTGIESDIGHLYLDKNKPVKLRFCKLDKKSSEKFYIDEPICLYSKSEFEDLLKNSGWEVERCWFSAFGNVKAVCG